MPDDFKELATPRGRGRDHGAGTRVRTPERRRAAARGGIRCPTGPAPLTRKAQLRQPPFTPLLQEVGPAAGLGGIEAGVAPASLLLCLQFLGAEVPVGNLLGEPVLNRRLGLGDQRLPGLADLAQMLGDHMAHRVLLRRLFQAASDPVALGGSQDRFVSGFLFGKGPVVEIRRIPCEARSPRRRNHPHLGRHPRPGTGRSRRAGPGRHARPARTRGRARQRRDLLRGRTPHRRQTGIETR